MCCACSSGQKNLVCGDYCKVCRSSFCRKLEIEKPTSTFDQEIIIRYCRPILEQHTRECSVLESSSPSDPQHSPIPPPQPSLTSSFPSSGVLAGDMISQIRENGNGAAFTSQEQLKDSTVHAEELLNIDLLKNTEKKSFHDNIRLDGTGKATSADDTSGSVILERHEDCNDGKVGHLNNTLEDVRSIIDGDESDGAENAIHSSNAASFLSTTETDPLIWNPPAPVDIEDDMDSVANYDDDDDEYSDGTKWGQSSCLSGFDVEHVTSLKEERQKAMVEAMNGQFKILVSRFLASEDISFSEGGHGEKWLDTVASLSWEAALLIKPEANEGRAMDPGSYVKVKCVASGARSQSEVIKGLVFKKHTAHKHMPTKCKNPRLLLLQGVLGHREVGLSSFNAMKEDDDYLKSIHETIKACNPNVVLVEKSVSRDMQEFLLEQGMTLVFDMKLTRLNRIARCIGSPIISCADILSGLKVKQCDMFHVEKFVEEHNGSNEGGKRPSKTLMFLEGFPKPLGCTILLKGAPIVELKKVKRVLQYTVFAAYHLIVETSFVADQRALFPDMHAEENGSLKDKIMPANACGEAPDVDNSCTNCNPVDIAQEYSSQVPSSNGSLENSIHEDMYSGSNFKSNGSLQSPRYSPDIGSNENKHGDLVIDKLNSNTCIQPDTLALPDLPWQFMSSFSSSLKKFLSDSFVPVNSESMSSYFGLEEELDSQSVGSFPVSPSLEAHGQEAEATSGFIQENQHVEISDIEKVEPSSSLNETIEHNTADLNNKSEMQNKDNIENVLDPQSILVLMSSQCLEKGVVCEQSHLSRIKYYGNFDVSLGRFLRDTLLSKKHRCSSCGEPPEAHVYCYTHQNGNLTVLIKELDSPLSGEQEGKIWMWTRCLKCEHENGRATSTERVIMSTAARGLSFGKFLELSFSSHSVASRLSSKCGHSLHRDCLRFFGLGSKVAMFRYSSVEIYAACKPPPIMEFNNQNGHDWIKREAKSVLRKGDLLFLEVSNFLQKLKHGDFGLFQRQPKNSLGSVKDLCEAEKMLIQEKSEFEVSLLRAINFSGQLGKSASEILSLSWLNQELLLELYIWDCRLHSLLQCTKDNDDSHEELQDQFIQDNALQGDKYIERTTENHETDLESSIENPTKTVETSLSSQSLEPDLRMESAEISENERNYQVADLHGAIKNDLPGPVTEQASFVQDQEGRLSGSENMQVDHSTPAIVEQYRPTDVLLAESEVNTDNTSSGGENSAISMSQEQHTTNSFCEDSSNSKSKDPNEWIWSSAVELRRNYRMDLCGGSLQKFEYILSYTPKYLSPIQLLSHERELLHFPLGADGGVISVCDDDISSMIACALARSEHQHSVIENIDEKDALEGKGEAEKVFDNSWSLTSNGTVASTFWSSTGSVESEGIHPSRSLSSLSSDESSTSGSESSFFVDRLIASENLHPEISVGGRKASARNKYSVVLVHAKQFYSLRRMCCPSELAYISSLSRSKRWDAQGGKSKAFFAKTLDDRFIIKQVKKTEIDSFLKFAPEYFRHINYSVSSGSQTCLAKILGIYQVRQSRGGKEVKTDLMVMENLLFGRNFARTYDLKGAVFSRYVSDPNEPEKVLLDENFVEDMRISPMYIAGRNKHLFQRAIWNDTSFLTSINVMDYSLLVGVDKQRRELVFGIIDYLRQYTWDKQLETWVKSSLVVPKNSLPTVISPKEYKKRFRKFMSKYFLTVPDTWRSEQCSGPCKFCNDGNSSSAENCQNSQTAAISNT